MNAKRAYYDLTLDESAMGECEPADLERFCELAATTLETELGADVRVRFGNGGDSYTAIDEQNYTWQGPLTDEMKATIERVYQAGEWVSND